MRSPIASQCAPKSLVQLGSYWLSLGLCTLILWAVTACKPSPESPAPKNHNTPPPPSPAAGSQREWFTPITEASGIRFVHRPSSSSNYFMPDHIGSGGAVLDFDRDGRMDLYLVQNSGPTSNIPNQLFHQQTDGTFKNVSQGSGLDVTGYGMGAIAGDINNDGWPDLLVTEFGRARMFLNRTNATFAEISGACGIDNPHWATAASFVDYDRDGWLDVVIANYVDYPPLHRCRDATGNLEFCGPEGFPHSVSRIFRNLGSTAGRFQDRTVASGFAKRPGPALGVFSADFTGDGWPDVLFADDASVNRLFVNQHDGSFIEEGATRGLAYNALGQTAANMGIAVGDFDQNGKWDVFVTHLAEEQHALWNQEPTGVFQDQTAMAGLTRLKWRGTGFGNVAVDFDHDGNPDLAWVNGRVKRSRGPLSAVHPDVPSEWAPYAQRHQLVRNSGKGAMVDISEANPTLSGRATVGRALLSVDLNNDGAMDLVMGSIGSPVIVLRNTVEGRGHWLLVRALETSRGGRDAIGARVRVQVQGRHLEQLIQPSSGYLTSHDPRVHFGLGTHERYEGIEVIWADGTSRSWPGGAADRIVVLER